MNIPIKIPARILCPLLLALLLFSACDDFVQVGVPDSELSGPTVFANTATAEAALVNIYAKLRNGVLLSGDANGLSVLLGNAADELTCYSNTGEPEESFFQNNLLSTNAAVKSLWSDSYNLVYDANAVIEGVAQSIGIPQQDKDRLQGEALFLRCCLHFYLSNLYGAVPYVTSTDYKTNSTIGKLSTEEMETALISDLQTAISLLPEDYRGEGRARANRSVAKALLARVYLYAGQYAAAASEASEVINTTELYSFSDDLTTVFLADSGGTIWQLRPSSAGANTLEAQSFIFASGPPPNRAMSPELLGAFETGDLRKTAWIGSVTDGVDTWYYPYKYKQLENTGSSVEYSIVFRIEEMYFIRAESLAQTGDLDGARADLDKIRLRAGLPDTTAATPAGLVQAILNERRVELFTEHGQRWFDLKRSAQASVVLGAVKPGWDDTDVLLPLPDSELLLNPSLLPQNPGY
jgi:hypothetical protein